MPRHRFGASMNRARQNLASRSEEARMQAARADLELMNQGSLADRVVMDAQGAQRELNKEFLKEDIQMNGKNEFVLGWYPLATTIGEKLLPNGVTMNGKINMAEHISQRRFDHYDPTKAGRGYMILAPSEYMQQTKLETESFKYIDGFDGRDGQTPDKLNKLDGMITLDERVAAQLSIAASLVLRTILNDVPSDNISNPQSHYKTTRVIFVEDLITYIHSNFSQNITIDPETGDAFERLTMGDLPMFASKLFRKFRTQHNALDGAAFFSSGTHKETTGEDVPNSIKVGLVPSMFEDVYKTRLDAMCTVSKENVGKVWQSKKIEEYKRYNDDRNFPYNACWIAVAQYLKANPRLEFGTRIDTGDIRKQDDNIGQYDIVFDVACSILTLICLHVVTYAMSYAIDAYVRLAIRGAERNSNGVIVFTHENVITPQIIFPGIRAALEMYGVSAKAWDKEVAFNLSTNKTLMEVFLLAKKAYDIDNSKPGVKRFSNPVAEDPYWTRDRLSRNAAEENWEGSRGRYNTQNASSRAVNDEPLRAYSRDNAASDLADSIIDYNRISPVGSDLERIGVHSAVAAFGRRRPGKKHSSFGKKHSSFGKKRRASGKGKKRRGSSKKNSFGKKRRSSGKGKKRRGSKKH